MATFLSRVANFIGLGFLLILSGCAVHAPQQQLTVPDLTSEITQGMNANAQLAAQATAPPSDSISNALIPNINLHIGDDKKSAARFDVVVNDAPAAAFFASLAKDATYNIVVSPKVSGNITLDLKHVTVEEVLQAVHNIYGYRFEKESYGYTIFPLTLKTKIFHVAYLDMKRYGTSETSISSEQISTSTQTSSQQNSTSTTRVNSASPASTVTTQTVNDFWGELRRGVAMIISAPAPTASVPTNNAASSEASVELKIVAPSGASVVVNPQAGLVMVKGYPDQLEQVGKYLQRMQNIMHREVTIDAKIIEVTLNAAYQSGIDWTLLGAHQTGGGDTDLTTDLKKFTSIFTLKGSGQNMSAVINLLNTQGRVNVLSSPRITTVNNQKALIKVGTDDFYITGIESSTTSSSSTTTSQNVQLTPFFSGVALDVTPEIDNNGEIILHIHPIVSDVTTKDTSFTTASGNSTSGTAVQKLPLASSTIRESDNIVRVKNNQMVLIGGLMQDKKQANQGATPLLSHIPVVGWFFKRKDDIAQKTEIVILLQPRIMTDQAMQQTLRKATQRLNQLNQDFSFKTTIDKTFTGHGSKK